MFICNRTQHFSTHLVVVVVFVGATSSEKVYTLISPYKYSSINTDCQVVSHHGRCRLRSDIDTCYVPRTNNTRWWCSIVVRPPVLPACFPYPAL